MAPLPVAVDDPCDPRLAPYRHLTDGQLRRSVEGHLGVFVVEGALALGQLAASPYEVVSVLVADRRLASVQPLLAGLASPLYVAPTEVLSATVGFDLHRGVVAVGRRRPPADPATVIAIPGPLLVVEGVNDHENLGALFRTGRALGAVGALLDPTCADPLYRRSVRVSLGHVLRVPFATVEPWPAGLAAVRRGRRLVALTPAGDDLGRLGPDPATAVMVGAEGPGLSAAALAAADVGVRIPMAPGVDSLNVATAAGIALHRLVPMVQP